MKPTGSKSPYSVRVLTVSSSYTEPLEALLEQGWEWVGVVPSGEDQTVFLRMLNSVEEVSPPPEGTATPEKPTPEQVTRNLSLSRFTEAYYRDLESRPMTSYLDCVNCGKLLVFTEKGFVKEVTCGECHVVYTIGVRS